MQFKTPITTASARSHPEVGVALADLQRSETYTARTILGLCIAWGFLPPLFHGHVGGAILSAILWFVIGSVIYAGVSRFILKPRRRSKVRALSSELLNSLSLLPQPISQRLSWFAGTPGAIVITKHGELALCDQSTDYDEIWLRPANIISTSVEREATQITNTKHGGRFTFGGVSSGGLFGGYTMGGRSRSVTHTVETAFLEMHYQLEPNGQTYTTVMPFDTDRRGAESWRASLSRLVYVNPETVADTSAANQIPGPDR